MTVWVFSVCSNKTASTNSKLEAEVGRLRHDLSLVQMELTYFKNLVTEMIEKQQSNDGGEHDCLPTMIVSKPHEVDLLNALGEMEARALICISESPRLKNIRLVLDRMNQILIT